MTSSQNWISDRDRCVSVGFVSSVFVSVTLSPFSSVFGWSSIERQTDAFRSDFVDRTGSVAAHSDALVPSVFVVVRSDSAVASNGFLSTHFLIDFTVADRRSAQLVGSESFTPLDVGAGRKGAMDPFTIVGIVVGALLLLVVAVAGIWYCRREQWPSMDYSASSVEFELEPQDVSVPTRDLGTFENVITHNPDLPASWQSGMPWLDSGLRVLDEDESYSRATFLGE
jgi:hypothetical protein